MMKTTVIAVIGFGFSLGLTSGVMIVTSPKSDSDATIVSDTSANDIASKSLHNMNDTLSMVSTDSMDGSVMNSAVLDGVGGDNIAVLQSLSGDSVPRLTSDSSNRPGKVIPVNATVGAGTNLPSVKTTKGKSSSENGMIGRLANMFAGMPPADAVRILAEMEDRDLSTILLVLPKKQQSAILSHLTTERAAAIAKMTLRNVE